MSVQTKYINYINDNINELNPKFRKEVLQMLIYSNIDDDKIVAKGSGTQIKFADIDQSVLISIYNFIYKKIESPSDFI
jgi:hypothetical protein